MSDIRFDLDLRPDNDMLRVGPDIRFGDLTSVFRRRGLIRVLVVVDGSISYQPGVGFGVARVIEILRSTSIGCTDFTVDVAERNGGSFSDNGHGGGTPGHLRYDGFRFDAVVGGNTPVLDRYDTVMLFGINSGDPDSVDGNERAAIGQWMDEGGGVFATGDHDVLGENLAAGVPRVRSMRRWTVADGVPPIGGTTRIDTHQPANPAQSSGAQLIPGNNQTDDVPQPITWHPEASWGPWWARKSRPHEILCHPFHGPIDVMPDHAHEGLCLTEAEITGDPARAAEFPGVLPKVIATGRVVPDPPHVHAKGDVDARDIPMISVYDGWDDDGHKGRIVVDSTWHHWMDLNLLGLEAENGPEWHKIQRFFVNVAKWTARKGRYRSFCFWDILGAFYAYPGIEELRVSRSPFESGRTVGAYLTSIHGPCTVTRGICDLFPSLCEILLVERELEVIPLPIEHLETVIIGGAVEALRPVAERIDKAMVSRQRFEVSAEELEKLAVEGAREGLQQAIKQVRVDCVELDSMVTSLDR